MKRLSRAACALATVFAFAAPAAATSFDFSYRLSDGNILSGVLTGDLQADNNTVLLNGVTSLALNGSTYTQPLTLASTDDMIFQTSAYTPSLNLSGSYLDFALTGGNDYLGFAVGDNTAAYFGANIMEASSGFGGSGNVEAYTPSSFQVAVEPAGSTGLSQTSTVPEPATWAMMLTGFGFIGFALRRRRRAQAIA